MQLVGKACLAIVLLLGLITPIGSHAAPSSAALPSLYGLLKLPPSYFQHPDSSAAINQLQPGSVLLTSRDHSIRVPVQQDGSFVAYRVPFGSYVLQSEYHDFVFPTVRVEVLYKESSGHGDSAIVLPIIRGSANEYPVTALDGTGLHFDSPLVIPVMGVHQYYVPRDQYSILDILKSPMIIMMIVSFGLMGMLKLFPEEELKESQRMSKEWQKKMLNRAAGISEDDNKEITDKKKSK